MKFPSLLVIGCATSSMAWMPDQKGLFSDEADRNPSHKIRGVNLGSLFVFEPWMASTEWNSMGCSSAQPSEFDCVSFLGQAEANSAFQKHWASWVTESDLDSMKSYGLNSIRVPVGYWLKEDLVSDGEHFPQGGIEYLDRLVGWASERNIYVIIDLHGAPGAQSPNQPSTGQHAPTAGFYQTAEYERAYEFLGWMTTRIHTNGNYTSVGMLEVLNEPLQGSSQTETMISEYYPKAYSTIRDAEDAANVATSDRLTIQMMARQDPITLRRKVLANPMSHVQDKSFGSGDPTTDLSDKTYAAYDDHRYLKYANPPIDENPSAYLQASCNDNPSDGESPLVVGEWSLSPPTDVQDTPTWAPDSNVDFYKKWWAAQVMSYERQQGWVFWSWKAELGDYRWSYKDAVNATVISEDPQEAYDIGACSS